MQEQIEAVQRMQDYIAQHITENITLTDLAKVAMFSPWYARRIFILHTGVSPSDYIRRLRLKHSALRLRDEKCSITYVAFDLGFGSVDGYTRAFAREFGCNPKQYALDPIPLPLFNPYGVKFKFIARRNRTMQKTKNVFIQLIDKPDRKVIIKRGVTATEYWTYCNEVGCDVWGMLTSIKSISGEPICLWLPKQYIKDGTSEYVQGVEVPCDYSGVVPDGFDIISLPAAKYIMFQGEPFAEEDFGMAIEEVREAIKKYDPSIIGYKWDKNNPRIQLEPIGTRGYIELLAIK
ncbi:MAG: helix-turn-helix transcriptional regulator [Clostridiales bacterium]|nr:helix-turn-helix transcriptional regulator [Clostridiales bacterium]